MESGRGRFETLASQLDGAAVVHARSRNAFPPHMHDEYGIGLIQHGAQKSRSGRGLVEACEGDLITCNPGEVHDGLPIGGEGRVWTMLYFEPQLIASVAADILEGKGGSYEFVSPRLRDERLACRFRELVATATRDHEAELRCGEELLIKLVGRLIRPASALSSAVPTAIATARARIDDAPDAAVPLSILAAEVGLSRFQLLRGFEKATGLTPHAYRIQRRLHRVRRLIARGTPLAEASIACGFADQSHMTRLFVRIHGVSPGAYARAIG